MDIIAVFERITILLERVSGTVELLPILHGVVPPKVMVVRLVWRLHRTLLCEAQVWRRQIERIARHRLLSSV